MYSCREVPKEIAFLGGLVQFGLAYYVLGESRDPTLYRKLIRGLIGGGVGFEWNGEKYVLTEYEVRRVRRFPKWLTVLPREWLRYASASDSQHWYWIGEATMRPDWGVDLSEATKIEGLGWIWRGSGSHA